MTDPIRPGDTASVKHVFTTEDVVAFARLSSDNLVVLDGKATVVVRDVAR